MNDLPSTIGPVEFTEETVRLWCADERKFDPIIHAGKPHEPQPTETVAPLPIALLPSSSFIPREYQIHIHSQLCINCNTASEWSCCYAYNDLAPRAGIGKRISHLVPVTHFSYNVPVRMIRVPSLKVPACHECGRQNLDLSRLPRPQDTEEYKRILAAYQERQAPKAARPNSPKTEAPKKKYSSMDDFI